jgi:hypothetical protein
MPQTSTVTAYRFLYLITLVGLVLLGIYACRSASKDGLFKKIDPKDSGIHFSNRISENDTMNILTFEYINNGGGWQWPILIMIVWWTCIYRQSRF